MSPAFRQALFCAVAVIVRASGQGYVDDFCYLDGNGTIGVCKLAKRCAPALQGITMGVLPKTCGFEGNDPIVCCEMERDAATAGKKSESKCKEYSKHIYVQSPPQKTNVRICDVSSAIPLIVGNSARPREFPHMVEIGYDNGVEREWSCGGSLISERFVLTMAACLAHNKNLRPKYVKVGNRLSDDTAEVFGVAEMVVHPNYKRRQYYDNLGLIKLDRDVALSPSVRPACLDTNPNRDMSSSGVIYGWDLPILNKDRRLSKIYMKYLNRSECINILQKEIVNSAWLKDETEKLICARQPNDCFDLPYGSSLVEYKEDVECSYKIVGVLSLATPCLNFKIPTVFTRVYKYIEWIEDIVWP